MGNEIVKRHQTVVVENSAHLDYGRNFPGLIKYQVLHWTKLQVHLIPDLSGNLECGTTNTLHLRSCEASCKCLSSMCMFVSHTLPWFAFIA